MVNSIDAQQFLKLFSGKTNTYVVNELPREKPAEGTKIKTKIRSVEGTVDWTLLSHHLDGEYGVGICPVGSDGRCHFAVIDIDFYGARLSRVLAIIRDYQLPLIPFRSKSGGLHLYLMLRAPDSARAVRNKLAELVDKLALEELYGKGKIEIFPKQDSTKGFGSAVTLPYFNCEEPYTYLLDADGGSYTFKEALNYTMQHQTTLELLQEAMDGLPYGDAPPCIQRILLSGAVGTEDTGRNNFLYNFAIYAKKKYGTDFEGRVEEVNNGFECPLDSAVVSQTCTSIREHEYLYKCRDIPCLTFCNKAMCKKVEFGLGRDKGHFTGVDYGQLYRYKALEPYYLWKLRLNGQEEWVDVVFKDETFLLDQKVFAKMCVRYLNRAPMQVSNNDWYATINTVLPNIQEVAVNMETDTSGLSSLHSAFVSYLSNKQARRECPYQIRVGLCVYRGENGKGKYFFTHKGFYDYLSSQRIRFDMDTMRETLKSFGAVEDELVYTNVSGDEVHLPCWSKADDGVLQESYRGNLEIAEEDRRGVDMRGIGEVDNMVAEDMVAKEKEYSQGDMDRAETLF